MRSKLTIFGILTLFVLMVVPAYADVTSLSLEKSFYTIEEKIAFKGIEKTVQNQFL